LHRNDPEKAHDLLARNPATPSDPWLLAAEIALAMLAERRPRYFKRGIQLLQAGELAPGHLTELASALGTAELFDGSAKRSRQMFLQSVVDPTGNALAQGEWVTPFLGTEFVPREQFQQVFEASEAAAHHEYRALRLSAVPELCEAWAKADAYSIRPYEFGSNAASMNGDYDKALQMAERGLQRRPDAPTLLNAKAFALGSTGKHAEAAAVLRRLPPAAGNGFSAFLTAANKGLCAMRAGRVEEGRLLYEEAIAGFKRLGDLEHAAYARLYLAREAVLAGLPDSSELISEADKAMRPYMRTPGGVVFARFREAVKTGTAANPRV